MVCRLQGRIQIIAMDLVKAQSQIYLKSVLLLIKQTPLVFSDRGVTYYVQ